MLYRLKMYAYAEHEVIGVVEVVEAVSDVDIGLSQDMYLKRQNLIEAFQVFCLGIDEIMADTEVDGEIRHDELHAS